jgi:hydroxyacylglutathione hydrolase
VSTSTKRQTAKDTTRVALAYFEALASRDVDALVACWRPGGVDHFVGDVELVAPHDLRDYFTALFRAFPDFEIEVLSTTADSKQCAVRWRAQATFAGPGPFQGVAPTGGPIAIEACDVVEVADGQVVANHAYVNQADVARQIGVLPPAGSTMEQRMTKAFNGKTRAGRRVAAAGDLDRVADGVWLLRGGVPREMNVYLIEDDGQVTLFDAGIRIMAPALVTAAAPLGGIKRVVLGHGHVDHRGAAPRLGAPVYCHPLDREVAEGDGGRSSWRPELLKPHARVLMTRLLEWWDGGPVSIEGTIDEGEDVAGFRVVHIPGHSPGQIALFRESDRLALTTDCFYTLNIETTLKGPPRIPHRAFTPDYEAARASILKIAALEPSAAWPGHANPVVGDVRAQLERAAAAG